MVKSTVFKSESDNYTEAGIGKIPAFLFFSLVLNFYSVIMKHGQVALRTINQNIMHKNRSKRLIELIGAILHEEQQFRKLTRQMQLDDGSLYEEHRECRDQFECNPLHMRLKKKHDKVFIKATQQNKEHKRMTKFCMLILDQLKQNCYNYSQLDQDELLLERSLDNIVSEHRKILHDLSMVRSEHVNFMAMNSEVIKAEDDSKTK